MKNLALSGFMSLVMVALLCSPALAGSHLWVINEVFSSPDGSVQFIEMMECCGAANETFIGNKWVKSATTGYQYDFTENLPPGSTANAHLLLATAAFAALPGAPTPDHIIQENFFDLTSDEIIYWLYTNSILEYGPGELPLDGITSLNQDGTTGVNSPTNFAGETGSVIWTPPPEFPYLRGDTNGDGTFNPLVDAVFLLGWGFVPGSLEPPCHDAADANDDGALDPLVDTLYILGAGFVPGSPPVPPPHPECSFDPTDDTLTCATSFCP